MTDLHRLSQEREDDFFWPQQRTHRAQMVNDYAEPGPDVIEGPTLGQRIKAILRKVMPWAN